VLDEKLEGDGAGEELDGFGSVITVGELPVGGDELPLEDGADGRMMAELEDAGEAAPALEVPVVTSCCWLPPAVEDSW
jgi:hypothetical protein